MTRCLAHAPKASTLVGAPISPLYTSEWPFDQGFCSFPKDDIFLGHPVETDPSESSDMDSVCRPSPNIHYKYDGGIIW